MPLSQYLTGPSGAHERYRPADLKNQQARKIMDAAHAAVSEGRKSEEHKESEFLRVCEQIKPVLHMFFVERWQQPAAWLERRLAYSRSLAASSMAGFVLGLGDRHSSNVLIDKRSAELVHIDLGIALDQGRLLKTPESVPFRLTRDLVDGLGVTGVDGAMVGAAQHAMRVLRDNSEALLTILQVFTYNPLYKWALERKRIDGYDEVTARRSAEVFGGNREAARAIVRVQLKLEGGVQGRHDRLGVEGQVRHLIEQARDPKNLSQLFPGWGAWL
eukprot:6197352-Pleurochrysis_carterae.AAC.1